MSKKRPYTKTVVIADYEYLGDKRKTMETFGDCAEADCPYYTQNAGVPSFCTRAQRQDDDMPKQTQSIGFEIIKTFLPNDK